MLWLTLHLFELFFCVCLDTTKISLNDNKTNICLQTVRFKNELERNITIKLGYANAKVSDLYFLSISYLFIYIIMFISYLYRVKDVLFLFVLLEVNILSYRTIHCLLSNQSSIHIVKIYILPLQILLNYFWWP